MPEAFLLKEPVLDEAAGIWHRPGSSDWYEIKHAPDAYKHLDVEDEVVLDLGGHIGCASVDFLRRGASRVISVEPDEGNVAVLSRNLEAFQRSKYVVVHAAVVPMTDEADSVVFYPSNTGTRSSGTLSVSRGRDGIEVPARRITDLLRLYEPTVIKADIEGAEFSVLGWGDLPEHVWAISAEIHLRRKEWRDRFPSLIWDLQRQGFTARLDPWRYVGSTTAWPIIVDWTRPKNG